MNSDSVIASKMKSIYIENEGKDIEFLVDHWCIDWKTFCQILFEEPVNTSSKESPKE